MSKIEEEMNEYLSKFTCRGCYNHCSLDQPNCARSKIFIKEALEKLENKNNLK